MATSDEELDAKRTDIEKLRDELAAAKLKRSQKEATVVNDITAAQLDAEKAQLLLELEEEKRMSTLASVRESSSSTLDAARDTAKAAREATKAVVTNAPTKTEV